MSPTFDPMKTAAQIYPILEFRDKVVRAISSTIEKIPGLEALVEKITETLTLFILSLLAPFIRPIISAVSAQLKAGSSTVVDASGQHQYEVWTDPHCSDPTHSLLSKDHFSNILNEPAGQVAAAILKYVAPRVIYAWEHPDVPVQQILDDVVRVFHHPAIRDPHCEVHRNMFDVVQRWVNSRPDRGATLNDVLGSEGVRQGKNHVADSTHGAQSGHGGLPSVGNFFGAGSSSHSKVSGAPWEKLMKVKDAAGGRRDDVDLGGTADALAGAYPGTETEYDSTRPSTEFQHPQYASQPYDQSQPQPQSQQNQNQYPYAYDDQHQHPSQAPPPQPFDPYAQQVQAPYRNQQQQSYQDPYQGMQYPPPAHQQTYQDQYAPAENAPYPPQQGYAPSNDGYPYPHDPNGPPPQHQGQQGPYGYGGAGQEYRDGRSY